MGGQRTAAVVGWARGRPSAKRSAVSAQRGIRRSRRREEADEREPWAAVSEVVIVEGTAAMGSTRTLGTWIFGAWMLTVDALPGSSSPRTSAGGAPLG